MKPEVEKIYKDIAELKSKLYKIQNECSHSNYKSEYGADTGNWDSNDDCYWLTVDCLDCGQHMHFDSKEDSENYYKYSPF
jgi:hypothetical protein